jgi:cold shock CspA family protein
LVRVISFAQNVHEMSNGLAGRNDGMGVELRGRYECLNMGKLVCVFEGVKYPSVQHALVASKTTNMEERLRFNGIKMDPKAAWLYGRKSANITLDGSWQARSGGILFNLLRSGVELGGEDMQNLLVATGSATLVQVEVNNMFIDDHWCKGNAYGKKLMIVRKQVERGRMGGSGKVAIAEPEPEPEVAQPPARTGAGKWEWKKDGAGAGKDGSWVAYGEYHQQQLTSSYEQKMAHCQIRTAGHFFSVDLTTMVQSTTSSANGRSRQVRFRLDNDRVAAATVPASVDAAVVAGQRAAMKLATKMQQAVSAGAAAVGKACNTEEVAAATRRMMCNVSSVEEKVRRSLQKERQNATGKARRAETAAKQMQQKAGGGKVTRHDRNRIGESAIVRATKTKDRGNIACRFYGQLKGPCREEGACAYKHDDAMAKLLAASMLEAEEKKMAKQKTRPTVANGAIFGTVTRWLGDRWYGWLRPDNQAKHGSSVMVHGSDLSSGNMLQEGKRVWFELGTCEKGRNKAVRVGGEGVYTDRSRGQTRAKEVMAARSASGARGFTPTVRQPGGRGRGGGRGGNGGGLSCGRGGNSGRGGCSRGGNRSSGVQGAPPNGGGKRRLDGVTGEGDRSVRGRHGHGW